LEPLDKIKISILLMFSLILVYGVAFSYFENLSLLNGIYYAITTITTVGFGDITPKTNAGKIITSIYVLLGVSIGLYTLGNFAEFFVSGYFQKTKKLRKMEKKINLLENHYIICGFGKSGKIITNKFTKENIDFVVVDNNKELLENELENNPKFKYIVGDATHDEILEKAKIKKAKGLISVVSTDSDNVYIVLSARRLNPKLYIIAKGDEKVALDKLRIAGADKVVSPHIIGGLRIAELAIKPGILDFVSTFMSIAKYEYDEDLEIRKIKIGDNSPINNKTLENSNIRNISGAIIIGIKKINDDKLITNPSKDAVLNEGDILYAFGNKSQIDNLEKLINGEN